MTRMPRTNADLEYFILDRIRREEMPLGAVTIREELEKTGCAMSETGVGRLLKSYRKLGYLERVGYQGHILTEAGSEHLGKMEAERALFRTLRGVVGDDENTAEKVLGILIARKALECEAAYWAAINATEDDIREIDAIVRTQYRGMERGEDYAEESSSFHRSILRAAKVPLLETLYQFIGLSNQWQYFFIGTFKLYHTPLNLHHEEILNAIRERNPQKAASAMASHMNDVIRNARKLIPELK